MTGSMACLACFVTVCAAVLTHSAVFAGPVNAESGVTTTSEAEYACLAERKVLFPKDQNCYKTLTTDPCENGEWLVLDDSYEDRFVLKCARKRCTGSDRIFRPEDGKCYNDGDFDMFCRRAELNTLRVNAFGEGVCRCMDFPVSLRDSRSPTSDLACHPLYDNHGGICPDGQVFLPVSVNTTKYDRGGACKPDPCLETGMRKEGDDGGNPLWMLWSVESGGDGRCHKIFSRASGQCPEGSNFGIDDVTLQPACLGNGNTPPTKDQLTKLFISNLNASRREHRSWIAQTQQ